MDNLLVYFEGYGIVMGYLAKLTMRIFASLHGLLACLLRVVWDGHWIIS